MSRPRLSSEHLGRSFDRINRMIRIIRIRHRSPASRPPAEREVLFVNNNNTNYPSAWTLPVAMSYPVDPNHPVDPVETSTEVPKFPQETKRAPEPAVRHLSRP